MKIQSGFLSSRAGRRIFWTLLLAAAAPILLFGAATYGLLSENFQSQARRQQVQLTKFAGMGLLDRLLVARTALDIASRNGGLDLEVSSPNRRGRVLLEVAQLDAQGALFGSRAALAQRWRDRVEAWAARSQSDGATLLLGSGIDATGARPVLMALRRIDQPGFVWIAQIDTAFLFSELAADASGERICVFEALKQPVFCAGWNDEQSDPRGQEAGRPGSRPSWNLFLRPDFGIDDWTLVSMDATPDVAPDAASLARLSALGAVATVLLVGMLGLIQVRRTLVPLERLIAGTRRLSERDFDARVDLQVDDEFGELAKSFNHMAERIGRQVQALHVQSSIDHEILNGLNVARVLQRVAQRLEQLMPGAVAAVVELDRTSRMLAHVHTADAPLCIVSVPRTDVVCMSQLPGDDHALCEEPPLWLVRALPRPAAQLWVRCARVGDELLGLLAIGADAQTVQALDTRREIAELCDRVSVTLASADRERRLLERATLDSLTGLANRAGLYEFIEARVVEPMRPPFTVMFIDLDHFKEVNDAMGHQFGDELLRAIARRLQQCVPPGTLVSRPGGDEFVLVLRGPREAADVLAPTLCAELAQPVPLGGRAVVVGASIGMACYPEHGLGSSDLMRRADMAMYSAKAGGGGNAAWFKAAMDTRVAERAALLTDLRHALVRGEFAVQYQPRIDIRSGAVVGAEALLRWRHPTRGPVPVPVFIELLEETGLIDAVGLWVIEQAAMQFASWRAQGLVLQSIAVNLSTRQLHAPTLPVSVVDILGRHGLQAADLELEVTETVFMGDSSAAIGALRQLHESGIHIALDDFGTGYSSLSYLHKLPISVLKVDRSFVVELGERDSAMALTRSIIALARALRMRVVAEGVELQRQADLLVELGCDEMQGFLYSPPLEPDAFKAFVLNAQVTGLATATA